MRFLIILIAAFSFGTTAQAVSFTLTVTQTPVALQSVPQGAQRVPMLQLDMQASCDTDVSIQDITLRHAGLGSSSDIPRIYLTDGTRRVSTSVSFSGRNRTATIRPRGLTLDACNKQKLIITADFAADAAPGGEHRVIVAGIKTDKGPADIVAADDTSSVRATSASVGTITVEYLPLHATVRYGNNRTVGRIRLSADGEADHAVTEIVMTNDGSARDEDLIHLELMDGQTVLAEIDRLDGDTAHFRLSEPLNLGRNASKLLTVRADVRASVKRTIRLIIEEPSDIVANPEQRRRQ